MHLKQANPKDGYVWVRQGFWLFKQNPFTFLMLVFLYVLIVQLSMFVPIVGILAVMVLTPALSLGFMSACKKVIRKEIVRPSIYLSAFREYGPQTRTRIIKLGLIYAGLIFTLSVIASQFVDFQKLIPLVTDQKVSNTAMVRELYGAIIIGGILYLPIAMLMWFAPMLVCWEDMPIAKSIFGSWIACWMNRGAFFVYLIIWVTILIVTPLFLEFVFDSLNLGDYATFLITPFSMGAITIFYCSFYASWAGCFIQPKSGD